LLVVENEEPYSQPKHIKHAICNYVCSVASSIMWPLL